MAVGWDVIGRRIFRSFEIEHLPPEDRGSYQTLGGFVMSHLGRIPTAADHFEWQGMRLEVVDMDGNRVDKVLVMPPVDESNEENNNRTN